MNLKQLLKFITKKFRKKKYIMFKSEKYHFETLKRRRRRRKRRRRRRKKRKRKKERKSGKYSVSRIFSAAEGLILRFLNNRPTGYGHTSISYIYIYINIYLYN